MLVKLIYTLLFREYFCVIGNKEPLIWLKDFDAISLLKINIELQ